MEIDKPVIFDIGAHRGETMNEYRSRFPDAMIYCFEPFPESREFLKKKVGTDSSTKIIPFAIADKPGQRSFYVNAIEVTNSLLRMSGEGIRYLPKGKENRSTIQVKVTSIDEFVRDNNLEKIDILKMDIQGGELMALNGASKTLKEHPPSVIYTEVSYMHRYESQPLFHDLWTFLNQFGYSLFDVYHIAKATDGQILFGDALFISTDVRKNVINNWGA